MATFLPACVFLWTPPPPLPHRRSLASLWTCPTLPNCAPLQALCESHGVRGMLLLAHEGINGTIAGPAEGVQAVLAWLRKDPALQPCSTKRPRPMPCRSGRMRVRLKKEIVTLGVPD